jgi:D-inositol-3-phosphate glycosyltransferase
MSTQAPPVGATRVLLVSHYFPPHLGGIENVVAAEAAHLTGAGYHVTVLSTAVGAEWGVHRAAEGYRVVRVPTWNGIEQRTGVPFPVISPRSLAIAAALIRDASIVHCHDVLYMTTWFASLMARCAGKPVVLTQHVAIIEHPRRVVRLAQRLVYRVIGAAVARSAARIFVVNERVALFLRRLGADAETIELLPNGTDLDRFHPSATADKRRSRRELGLPEDGLLALFVGRFVPKKGFDKVLLAAGEGYRLVLVGGPPPPGAGDHRDVTFVGSKAPDELAEIYRACDLFVLPSEGEGFPLAVQEAMACGLPVITTDDPGYGIYELDRERVAFIEPTVPALRSALRRVARDDVLRARMAHYSAVTAARRFSWSQHLQGLERAYGQAANGTGPRPPAEAVRDAGL